MQGPFVATVQIGSPFKTTSEPYTIPGLSIKPAMPEVASKRNLWPAIIAVCLILGFVVVLVLRKRPTQ